jgi:hypothetical protein
MDKVNDGGPAFPTRGEDFVDGPQGRLPQSAWGMEPKTGMTLRDWFAGQAMQGMAAEMVKGGYPRQDIIAGVPEQNLIAEVAFGIADAMLAERAKEKS